MSTKTRRVLMASPPGVSAGGMAAVSRTLGDHCSLAGEGWECRLIDSGGGTGLPGYRRFPGALATCLLSDYDLLHLHVASKGSTVRKALLARAAHTHRKPYVIHLHGAGYAAFLQQCTPRQLAFVRAFFQNAAQIIVLGELWRDLVVSRLGLSPDKVHIVHNGVTPALTPPASGRIVNAADNRKIIAVGEVSRRKGYDLLVEAIGEVLSSQEFIEYSADLIGNCPDDELRGLINRVNARIGGRINAPGPLFGRDKQAVYASAAVLCLPSRAEALPMTLLEAMSAGVPCITTDVGSIREIFPNGRDSGAVLLPTPDTRLLQGALEELLADAEQRRQIGLAGRARWSENFTADHMTRRVQEVWEKGLANA